MIGHLVFAKKYPSSKGYLGRRHECAFLLAKGSPETPERILRDVLPWHYTGNAWHPTQKPIEVMAPLIESFSKAGDIVLDPFAGSGTTGIAARQLGRRFIGIEKDAGYCKAAVKRLGLQG